MKLVKHTSDENVLSQVCRKCGNKSTPEFYHVCTECYAGISPITITESAWVNIASPTEKQDLFQPKDANLTKLIITSFLGKAISHDPKRRVIMVGRKLEIPAEEKSLDDTARKSGLLVGKWLIYERKERINATWNTIATHILKGELGTSAKVSTAGQVGLTRDYVICVYTKNYLDSHDVGRVRQKLRELGYNQKLYYKPDLYTYLNMYSNTFPNLRASRYAD